MKTHTDLHDKQAIDKLKKLVYEIKVALFCTNLKTDDGSTCRPMAAQQVCDQGNIWFFSQLKSDKNKEIEADKNVQLFFAHPGNASYLVVNGEAKIIIDAAKTEELWTPAAEAWFKDGKEDKNISIIKVKPVSAYYWDADGDTMINFFKKVAFVVTGATEPVKEEGNITV